MSFWDDLIAGIKTAAKTANSSAEKTSNSTVNEPTSSTVNETAYLDRRRQELRELLRQLQRKLEEKKSLRDQANRQWENASSVADAITKQLNSFEEEVGNTSNEIQKLIIESRHIVYWKRFLENFKTVVHGEDYSGMTSSLKEAWEKCTDLMRQREYDRNRYDGEVRVIMADIQDVERKIYSLG